MAVKPALIVEDLYKNFGELEVLKGISQDHPSESIPSGMARLHQ